MTGLDDAVGEVDLPDPDRERGRRWMGVHRGQVPMGTLNDHNGEANESEEERSSHGVSICQENERRLLLGYYLRNRNRSIIWRTKSVFPVSRWAV
jgi:hypothetical protein